ncbi:MAG: HNH endonuclease signature motif containing protein [Thiolinea sp.]
MSTTHIRAKLRRYVAERAADCCEYCLIHERDTFFGCQIDHIISEKHGGATTEDNLALACLPCNVHKGSDIASLDSNGQLTRLFNPRTDQWSEHFHLEGAVIRATTSIGEVTLAVLKLNDLERQMEREALLSIEHYPGLKT